MKKIVFIFMIISGISVFANSREKALERILGYKYHSLIQGAKKVSIYSYDVDINSKEIKVVIEIKGKESESLFEKISLKKKKEFFCDLATEIRGNIGELIPIKIKVELERKILPDKLLCKAEV